jgi:hypothetical protein
MVSFVHSGINRPRLQVRKLIGMGLIATFTTPSGRCSKNLYACTGNADRILPITASGGRTAKLIKGARHNQEHCTHDSFGLKHFHSSPSEPFPSTARAVRLIVNRLRGRAVRLAPHDSKEFGAFFCSGSLYRNLSRGFSDSSTALVGGRPSRSLIIEIRASVVGLR